MMITTRPTPHPGKSLDTFLDPLHEGCKFLAYAQLKEIPRLIGVDAKDVLLNITVRDGLLITVVQWPDPDQEGAFLVQQEVENCIDLIEEDFKD